MRTSHPTYIMMIGLLGSGKGTQVELIKNNFGYLSISSGTLFRREVRNGTELGVFAKKYALQGKSTPDKETNYLIQNNLISTDNSLLGIVFDGYPSNLNQANSLDNFLFKRNRKIDILIKLQVEEPIILDRLKHRLVCPRCDATYNSKYNKPVKHFVCNHDGEPLVQREDDKSNLHVIRLESQKITHPFIIDHYESKDVKILDINGNQTIQNVSKDIHQGLLNLIN